jgi:hypothetical protein
MYLWNLHVINLQIGIEMNVDDFGQCNRFRMKWNAILATKKDLLNKSKKFDSYKIRKR